LTQPHVRPIVRGKAGTPVEFGAKLSASYVNGYVYLYRLSWDNYNESGDFKGQALVQCNCEAETLTRQGINREHEVEAVLPKLALFAEYQERQQELVES
jgi:hypothetical protein